MNMNVNRQAFGDDEDQSMRDFESNNLNSSQEDPDFNLNDDLLILEFISKPSKNDPNYSGSKFSKPQ